MSDPFADLPPMPYEDTAPPVDEAYAPFDPIIDQVPPDDYADFGPSGMELPDRSETPRRNQNPARRTTGAVSTEKVLDTIRGTFAAVHDRDGEEATAVIQQVLAADNVLEVLDLESRRRVKRVAEVLIACAGDAPEAPVDLFDLADLEAASGAVVTEISLIRAKRTSGDFPKNPISTWRALTDQIQRDVARASAKELLTGLDKDLPADELMKLFAQMQPPTTQRTVNDTVFAATVSDWEAEVTAAKASRPAYRISSGYRTWDYVFTAKDAYGKLAEPLGAWAPGEFHAIAAPTGNGKSALARPLVTAAAEDLVNGWGHDMAKVLIAITEEAPEIVYRAASLGKGQPFHHLADHVVVADVGASRGRFIKAVYDLVSQAEEVAKKTGRPIVDAGLPEFIVLDYIGGIVEQGEAGDTTAIENTANLIMRGLCGWRIEEMEQFSGVSYAAHTGKAWPKGMENFRPAVLTFVQTKKLVKPEFYDPAVKSCSVQDYTVENGDGSPGWEVLPGDFIVPGRSDVRGSGVLQNHLTSLTMAHRSRPQKNKKVIDAETGRVRLEDDRARLIFLKTRNSSDMPFIPMRFDSNYEGLRGQYFDLLAERAISAKQIQPLDSYSRPGDPVLPARPSKSPFTGVAY